MVVTLWMVEIGGLFVSVVGKKSGNALVECFFLFNRSKKIGSLDFERLLMGSVLGLVSKVVLGVSAIGFRVVVCDLLWSLMPMKPFRDLLLFVVACRAVARSTTCYWGHCILLGGSEKSVSVLKGM